MTSATRDRLNDRNVKYVADLSNVKLYAVKLVNGRTIHVNKLAPAEDGWCATRAGSSFILDANEVTSIERMV